MSASDAFDTLHYRWAIEYPDGRVREVSTLPNHLECGVCCKWTATAGLTGRLACQHCGAYVATIVERRLH